MKTRIIRTTALALATFSLLAACKKEEAPAESAQPSGPVDVAPVPVEQDGVLRYSDETAVTGKAKVNAATSAHKGPDATSAILAALDANAIVEKKARRGDFVLVSWTAEAGKPSTGWVAASALADQAADPVILPVDAGTARADAGATTDAGSATDAGKADAAADTGTSTDAGEAASTDAGATEEGEKGEQAAADAGTETATTEDAGAGEPTAEAETGNTGESAATADAGASDGGTGFVRLPIKQRLPVLKLPSKAEN